MATSIRSPFRYPGGKYYARKLILEQMPSHRNYCEPFSGGGSVFFAKPLPSGASTLNDADPEVISTLRQIRDHPEALIGLLDGVEATKATHAYYKTDYRPDTDAGRAARWFYLNRTSYSGIMRHNNCYWGYRPKHSTPPHRWPRLLRAASQKLQHALLRSSDFEPVIDGLADNCFVFVDPPYYAADQHKFYNVVFQPKDHDRLARCLYRNRRRLRFLLTYDNVAEVRALYEWTRSVEPQQWPYMLPRTDDQRNGLDAQNGHHGRRSLGRELFIRNY